MPTEPVTVEQGADDFLFVLEPGTYWFVLRNKWWTTYRRALRYVWEDAFRTISTQEKTVKTDSGRKVLATYVVIEVLDPIMVSATIMGAPHVWEPGDNAQSVGAFDVPEEHWIVGAAAFAEGVQAWAAESLEEIEKLPAEAKALALEAKAKLGEILDKPEQWLKDVESKAGKIMVLFVIAGIGALAVYRATKD